MIRKIKKTDMIVLTVIIVIMMISFMIVNNHRDGQYVKITVNQQIYGEYNLHQNQIIHIHNDNTIEIKDGKVTMIQATCLQQRCIKQGSISHNGETIICLPHKTIIEVVSSKEGQYDAKS